MKLRSIQVKIILAVMLVLAISISALIFITLRNQRSNLLDEKLNNLVANNSMLTTIITNAMLDGAAPIAVSTLTDLKEIPELEQLEVYRRSGKIAFSDYSTLEKVNARLEDKTFERTSRIEAKNISSPAFEDVLQSNTPLTVSNVEEQRMEYYFPILNYQECRSCHGDDHFIRGVAYYRVSLAGIFARINNARENLTFYNLAVGAAVALLMILLMRRVIVNPVLRIGQVVTRVGEGDLDTRAEIKSADELGSLAEKINAMISGLKEKNRLEMQNRVIEARNQENRKYLDNILEGLLLVGRDYRISDQYSRHLTQLFGTEEVAGVYLPDFIYPGSDAHAEERRELEQFLKMLFENTSTDIEMILSINPLANKRLEVPDNGGSREIVVDANFQRIYSEGEVINVMIIFEDKTEIVETQKQLEEERQRSQSELENIATLLQIGPEAFTEFQEEAEAAIDRLTAAHRDRSAPDELQSLLRDTHSLKGNARYLGFRRFGEQAHALEDIISELQDQTRSWEEAGEQYEGLIRAMREELDRSREIQDKFTRFAGGAGAGEEGSRGITLSGFLEQLEKMTADIAEEQKKDVEMTVRRKVDELPHLQRLRNPLIHLVRNSIDHGIEDQYERLTAGKSAQAVIGVEVGRDGDGYKIVITDDGGGIDFDAVRARGEEKGLLDPEKEYSEKQLLSLLFSASFSTRTETTELSGRGVGLDAVYDAVSRLGGHITVATHRGRGTRFTITLPPAEEEE
jgi:HPt (histidine-containing phosphotransfer) domain-containing protein/HAMP domain-containing protein